MDRNRFRLTNRRYGYRREICVYCEAKEEARKLEMRAFELKRMAERELDKIRRVALTRENDDGQ